MHYAVEIPQVPGLLYPKVGGAAVGPTNITNTELQQLFNFLGNEINRQFLIMARNEWKGQWLEQFKYLESLGGVQAGVTCYLYPYAALSDGRPTPWLFTPAGYVTKAVVACVDHMTTGTATFSLQTGTGVDWAADGDIDTWTTVGVLGILTAVKNGEYVRGLSLDVPQDSALRVKVVLSDDWSGDLVDFVCELYFKTRTN